MDFQTILYIAGGIIYLLYQGNEGRKKARENRPQQSPPTKSWEQELEEMLKGKFPQQKEPSPAPVIKKEEPKKPVYKKPAPKPVITFEEEIALKKKKDMADYEKLGGSIEYIDQPVFMHDVSEEIGPEKEAVIREPIVTLDDFDARKAFIYGEIFNRKYE